jgi:hypothetical protein
MEWNGMEWNGMEWNGMEWAILIASSNKGRKVFAYFAAFGSAFLGFKN